MTWFENLAAMAREASPLPPEEGGDSDATPATIAAGWAKIDPQHIPIFEGSCWSVFGCRAPAAYYVGGSYKSRRALCIVHVAIAAHRAGKDTT